ncbi:C1 family peptidase [Ideonella sp. BN130291]|uniref:C1 family peptidase n=1 Tax=Ideonella sp. BN130291 TaxID=3112940 RepID=UPI002E26ABC9|nr:C1 family peptidase [Ideonella sp. BN130291]
MQLLMMKGHSGAEVDKLAKALAKELGNDATEFPVLHQAGAAIDDEFEAAIRRWQSGIGIIADGVVGPHNQVLLGLIAPQGGKFDGLALDVGHVSRLFPVTKPANIARYLPYIEAALGVAGLTDRAMVVGALGTIRSETEGFVPISEFQSKFNTAPGGAPFGLYDGRLGNRAAGDGARYRGRGFVQLTGRSNYATYGEKIGCDIEGRPDLANAPEVAAILLAVFLSDHAAKFRSAVAQGNLLAARKLVNGGSHGIDNFRSVFTLADAVWPAQAGAAATPARRSQRPTQSTHKVSKTKKDAADLRDREFMPWATSLPDEYPGANDIARFLPAYAEARLVLNQGQEGACTGFGLACVINYLRWVKAGNPARMQSVSPRMLYILARRHDEYQGENYEGSSCRGAIKGWFNNGVCLEEDWPYAPDKSNPARYGFATRATQNTLGVYYRVDTKSITDMQAAVAQHGAVFVSAFTHDGWDELPSPKAPVKSHADVPVIPFDGKPSKDGGHAFAVVGFNREGFLIQNSWGEQWGSGGFAVLSYLDWLANAMDAWVVSLGVPGVVAGRLASGSMVQGARAAGADRSKWWDSGMAYQHSVVLGNDGRVQRYLTEDEPPRKLQHQVFALPDQWFRTRPANEPKRLVLYVHGGLNDEAAAIKRASAMGRFFAGNGCYPLFMVWKTGLVESISGILEDARRKQPQVAGAGDWLKDKMDLLVEKTIGRPFAKPIWSEMKENAELAFAPRHGGELLLEAIQALAGTWGSRFQLHLVGHSAGSILLGHLLKAAAARPAVKGALTTVSLFAPACTVAFAARHYASDDEVMQRLYLDVLSDKEERDDNVASIYHKSLLYLVSNALETDLRTPILGLDVVNDTSYDGWDGSSDTGEALATWRKAADSVSLAQRTQVVNTGRVRVAVDSAGEDVTQPAAHGAFDNDIDVMTRTLQRITGGPLSMAVDDLRGY